jgi:hypothetical protein
MKNRKILTDAILNNTKLSFKSTKSSWVERNVTIISLQSDDVCNKEFTFETYYGDRFTTFENNIEFI